MTRKPYEHSQRTDGKGQADQEVPVVFLVDMDDTLLENDRIEDLRASQRYRVERLNNTHLLSMSRHRADYLFDHPDRGTLDVLERFRAWGPPTCLQSDGDIVFRPRQLGRSGIPEATGGPCAFPRPSGRSAG